MGSIGYLKTASETNNNTGCTSALSKALNYRYNTDQVFAGSQSLVRSRSQITCPSVFHRKVFVTFYRLLCKIANLWDMKHLGPIFDIDIDYSAKFRDA